MTNAELLDYLSGLSFKFWVCTDCVETTQIRWDGHKATCLSCGKTNTKE